MKQKIAFGFVLAAVLISAPMFARAEYGTESSTKVKTEAEIMKMKIDKESYEREKRAIEIRAKIAAVSAQIEELQKKLASLKAELDGSGTVSSDVETKMKSGKFEKDFSFGEKGEHVKKLQEILIMKGMLEKGSNTGYFGMMTKEAVRKFQIEKGIDAVGIIGPMTRAKLNVEVEVE